MSIRYLLPIILTGFVVAACNVINAAPSAPTPLTIATPTPLIPATLSGENVFHDTIVGFAFEYPEGWTIIGGQPNAQALGYSITMQSFEPGPGGGDGFPESESKVDLNVHNEAPTDTLDMVYTQLEQQQADGSLTLDSTEEITLEQGLPAIVVRGTGRFGLEFVTIHTLIKGHAVGMVGIGDEAYLWQVANSLRPE